MSHDIEEQGTGCRCTMKEAVYRLAEEGTAIKSTSFFTNSSVSTSTMPSVLKYHPDNF
jgi:hypothetical protein